MVGFGISRTCSCILIIIAILLLYYYCCCALQLSIPYHYAVHYPHDTCTQTNNQPKKKIGSASKHVLICPIQNIEPCIIIIIIATIIIHTSVRNIILPSFLSTTSIFSSSIFYFRLSICCSLRSPMVHSSSLPHSLYYCPFLRYTTSITDTILLQPHHPPPNNTTHPLSQW